MPNSNRRQVAGQSQKQNQKQNGREQDSGGLSKAAYDDGQKTGVKQRAASGYPEQNPRRGQHQEGGGIDKNEVGDVLKGDWEKEGGHQKDPDFDQPQTGDNVAPYGGGPTSIKGLGREQIRRKRSKH